MNILAQVRQRVDFDPTNLDHVAMYKDFIVKRKWENGCPFALEWPYLTIPDMIKDKIILNYLKV